MSTAAPLSLPPVHQSAPTPSDAALSTVLSSTAAAAATAASTTPLRVSSKFGRVGSTAGTERSPGVGLIAVGGAVGSGSVYGIADGTVHPELASACIGGAKDMPTFPSARSHGSYTLEIGDLQPQPSHDANSTASSRASALASVRASCSTMFRRCSALGIWRSLRAVLVAAWGWLVGVVTAPAHMYQQCKEDPVYATFVAVRIDKWACLIMMGLYIICISVLLAIEVRVGDHKLMLGDAPGNM